MLTAHGLTRVPSALLFHLTESLRQVGAGYSSQARPSIKTQLRELYKRVHPDLFHSHPQAREANERSFKLLQEYLSAAKEGGSFGGIAGVPYRFEFFLHQSARLHNSPQYVSEGNQATDGMQRVALTLPPPGRLSGTFPGSDQLSPTTEKALGRLLAACGLQNHYGDDASSGGSSFGGSPGQIFTAERLRDFVPEAAEMMRLNEASQFGPRQLLNAARTALTMARQVRVEFADEARHLDTVEKAELLQRLAAALDRVSEDVRGLTLLLGGGYGMDAQGRVRLYHRDSALMWSGFLLQMDLEGCRQRQAAVAAVRSLQQAVALGLGLPLIHTLPHLTLSAAYRAFLERLAAAGKERGPIFRPPADDLALRVLDERRRQSQAGSNEAAGPEDAAGFMVDQASGLVTVTADASSDEVYSFCQKHGPELRASLREQRELAADLEMLRHQTERRLRLRKLALDPSLPRDRLRACCLRLNQATESLKGLFDGLSVRISHINQAAPDSSYIDIGWNSEV